MPFQPDPRGKIERARIAAVAAIAELKLVQPVNLDAYACLVLKCALECARRGIVGVDAGTTFAEVADEERAAENAERRGREDDAPRRVERPVVDAER